MLDNEWSGQRFNRDCAFYNPHIPLATSWTDSKCQAQMLDWRQYRHRGTKVTLAPTGSYLYQEKYRFHRESTRVHCHASDCWFISPPSMLGFSMKRCTESQHDIHAWRWVLDKSQCVLGTKVYWVHFNPSSVPGTGLHPSKLASH